MQEISHYCRRVDSSRCHRYGVSYAWWGECREIKDYPGVKWHHVKTNSRYCKLHWGTAHWKIKGKRYALQVDEATDSNKDSLLIAYVRFVDFESLNEDLLFCKYIPKRATADELFKMIDSYLTEAGIKWEDCLGICTDGAQTMAGKRGGLQALIKRVAPKAQWTHCIIHREALASRQLSPTLNDVLSEVVIAVNYIKTRPLKSRLFSALCEEMGANHTAVLFHSEARWLSRGKVLSRVFELREQIQIFLQEEGMNELASKFGNEQFLMKLAYLSDIFSKFNQLNLQLQGKDKYLPHLADQVSSFIRKLEIWGRKLEHGNTESFENLTTFSKTNKLTESTVIPCMLEHISALRGHFQKYFPDNSVQFDWVKDPFTAPAPDDLSSSEEEQFIEMTSDSSMRLKFPSQTLCEFWLGVEREFPLIGQKAVEILLPFATSYLCETGFFLQQHLWIFFEMLCYLLLFYLFWCFMWSRCFFHKFFNKKKRSFFIKLSEIIC